MTPTVLEEARPASEPALLAEAPAGPGTAPFAVAPATTPVSTAIAPASPAAARMRRDTETEAQLWDAIGRLTLEACVLRKEGRERDAYGILSEELPPVIRAWSDRCMAPVAERQERLRALFAAKQEAVEAACLQQRLMGGEIARRSAGNPSHLPWLGQTAKADPRRIHVRRRVPIDDISDMLDAVAEAEHAAKAETHFPLRAAAEAAHRANPSAGLRARLSA